MLSKLEVAKNTEALFDAMRYIGADRIGAMVVYATAPVCVIRGRVKLLDREPHSVRFTHDKNMPKLAIDTLEDIDFHTEFSTGWQKFRFQERKKLLLIEGRSERFPNGYLVHLHLKGKRAARDA